MTMTVLVTRSASPRTRGFLASCMCEIAPGVYTGELSKRAREQVWNVIERWHPLGADRSAVMVWPDKASPGGQAIQMLGDTRYDPVEWQGTVLVRRDLTKEERSSLKTVEDIPF